MTHRELVELAARWLRGTRRCSVVLTEAQGGSEIPDALGWGRMGRDSILVECKATRADFLRDQDKPSRRHPDVLGIGQRRIYITAPDVIRAGECPAWWGHGEACPGRSGGGKVIRMRVPLPGLDRIDRDVMAREVPYLVAALTRIQEEPGAFCGVSGAIALQRVRTLDGRWIRACAPCVRAKRPCPLMLPEPVPSTRLPGLAGDRQGPC